MRSLLVSSCLAVAFAQDVPRGDGSICQRSTERPPPLTPQQRTSFGPERGSLVIAGGAAVHADIFDAVWDLAGGDGHAKIVYIPTNSGQRYETPTQIRLAIEQLEQLSGWTDVELLHTYDAAVANTTEFVEPLRHATGLWFGGGRPWRCAEAYLDTLTQEEFNNVLQRGGVIGGSSAGASMQGDPMIRGETSTNRVVVGDHWRGFEWMKNTAIDQHLLARARHDDLVEAIEYTGADVLGLGLDEDTAIVVQGDVIEVVGTHFVTVVDSTLWSPYKPWTCGNHLGFNTGRPQLSNGGRYTFLSVGDKYNVNTREVVRSKYDDMVKAGLIDPEQDF